MARANSKYFADIIAKFLDAKRKENIVIDDSFRDELKMKVMARAMEVSPQSSSLDEAPEVSSRASDVLPDRAPFDWTGFVRRFRYGLALVPSALLVFVVSNYVTNMSVPLESDVVVPMIKDEVAPLVEADDGQDVQPLFGRAEDVEEVGEGMVPEMLEEDQSVSQSEPQVQEEEQVLPKMQSLPQPQVVESEPNSQPEINEFSNQMDSYMNEFNFLNPPSVPVVPTPQVVNEESVREEVEKEPVAAPVMTESLEMVVPQMVESDSASATMGGSDEVMVKSAPVYYYTNLSTVEKQTLEGQIKGTVDQTNVMEIHVYSLSGDVFEIVVRYKDGSAVTKNLRKVGDTSGFDDVSATIAEEKAASVPVIVVPPAVPSGYYGPVEYNVLLDYDRAE